MTATARPADDAVTHDDEKPKSKSSAGAPPQGAGMVWFAGWLFTIGYLHLVWWKALLALLVWPWFLGDTMR